MAIHTVSTAVLQCSMGTAPSSLGVLPIHFMKSGNQFSANIMDHAPMVNIKPFGLCRSIANPSVAAATAAAMGALTPMPCIPCTPAPWAPGSPTVKLDNFPSLNNTSKLNCMWAGLISISNPGQGSERIV